MAVGREFPLPIDVQMGPTPTIQEEGQFALECVESNLPVLGKQRAQLLKVINDERRERHRELKNTTLAPRQFEKGNIVLVGRQVQSSKEKQTTSKSQFFTKGPYRVLGEATPGSYWV